MTDEKLIQMLKYRAAQSGRDAGLKEPEVVIVRNASNLYLGIKYDVGHDYPFFVRFSSGTKRGMFKLVSDKPEFAAWKATALKNWVCGTTYCVFDPTTVPDCVKHVVFGTIMQALKTKGMGLDCFALSFTAKDPVLVDVNESYEEVAIETDLLCPFDFC